MSKTQKKEEQKNKLCYPSSKFKILRDNKIKKFMNKKAMMSYSQILILIIGMFAFSFLIYQSSGIVESNVDEVNIKKSKLNFLKVLGLIIWDKLKEPILPMVSAQTDVVQCCEETNNGNICQEFLQQEIEENCAGTIFPGQCKEFANCKLGCCYDKEQGICAPNSPQGACEGEWIEDAACNIPQCSLGCCILGNNAKFTTEQRCNKLSESYGLTPDFDEGITNELQCILFTEKDDEGACVFEQDFETTCVFTTKGDCENRLGEFYKNKFCSDSDLNTICEAKDHTGCVENKDSVYWFDSCGNPEDIYQECDYFSGSICGEYRKDKDVKPNIGDYVCRDLSCDVEIYGRNVKKKNGESWCIYDGTIGEGKDVVGSRHIKHSCLNGEEVIEPCADLRNEICVQGDVESDGKIFTEAACRINRWRECAKINIEQDVEKKEERCKENSDCEFKQVSIDDSFTFPICTPQYPPGFDLKNNAEDAQMICGQASQKCTVLYVKELDGWDCEVNCDCEEREFTEKMHDYCVSLGDCGAYVNVEGKITDDGYSVKRAPKLKQFDLNKFKENAEPHPNQKPAEPGDLTLLSQSINDEEYDPENEMATGIGAVLGGIIGGTSPAYSFGYWAITESEGYVDIFKPKMGKTPETSAGGFGNWAASAAGAAAGSYVAMRLMGGGMPAGAALVISIASTVGGTAAGMATAGGLEGGAFGSIGNFGTTFLTAFVWAFIIAAIIIGIMKLFGIGDTKEKTVKFRCMPWQAPTGGLNCDLCNGNPFKPCSEYRCSSLGQTCEFINQGTGQEKCVDNSPNDVSSPKISPMLNYITTGYAYVDTQPNGFDLKTDNKKCIPEYTNVEYGIETDKPAQCKIGTSALETFEQMPDYFGGSNLYLTNHSSVMFMISPSAFQNQYNLTDEQMKSYGEMKYFVKCQSVNGITNPTSYVIRTCVKPGPDITPPYIANTNPQNGGYTAYNQTEQDLEIWTNEPADCRWSIFNEDYDSMPNEFDCQTSINLPSLYGWSCTTQLTNTHIDETFYIKCKDQPFQTEDSLRNPMQESYVYNLHKSSSVLKIDSFEPIEGAEIFSNIEPVSVELTAQTSGGAEDGKAECKYSFNENSPIRFFETYSMSHTQIFSTMVRGKYNINLVCEDVAGNTATAETNFKITIDDKGPRITRIYYDGGLNLWTNEEAECRYDFTKKFKWDNATQMSGIGLEHSADWKLKTYYIQCMDEYENKGGKLKVRAYNLV